MTARAAIPALAGLLALVPATARGDGHEPVFALPGGPGAEFVVTVTEPNADGAERRTTGAPRAWYVAPLGAGVTLGLEARGRIDFDDGDWDGTQVTIGLRWTPQ